MIEAFEGTLGAGKTFFSVCRMAEQVARGGMVFTNVEVLWEGFSDLIRRRFRKNPFSQQLVILTKESVVDFDLAIKWGTDEMNVLVVLDEIHLWWDQYQSKEFNKRLMAFLTQSRKANVDIIFISQDIKNVAVQFRRMLQYVWKFRDMATFTIPLWGTIIKSRLLGVCFDRDGKTPMRRVWLPKDPLVFKAYKTKSILTGLDVPLERAQVFKLDDVPVVPIWEQLKMTKKQVYVSIWLVIFALIFSAKLYYLCLNL